MAAIMEKRARAIFRDALGLHYFDGISKTGAEVDGWLKTHGGWFENLQEISRDGSCRQILPTDNCENVVSKEPEKAMKEAKCVMGSLKEFLGDGVAEHIGCTALKASVKQWLADLAPETPQGRDRSRSPRRCVIPQMMIATMEETIRLQDQTIKVLEGKIQEKNSELVKNAYRISYLETTVKAKDEMLAMKDDLHNKVMAAMESMFKKP
jgi:hypothetical protein